MAQPLDDAPVIQGLIILATSEAAYDAGDKIETVGWTGEWPPPERLIRVVGKLSGITKIVERKDLERSRREHRDFLDHVTVEAFVRTHYSRIMGPPLSHVERLSLYLPDWREQMEPFDADARRPWVNDPSQEPPLATSEEP